MTTAIERNTLRECEPVTETRVAKCDCCCPEPHRCGVECLERPAFHPGQLLTAESLRLGQHYVEQRLALRRYVDGVGIVCGLGVRCDPKAPGRVVIEPGYAVGCCGEDIVVCEPFCVDVCACIAQCRPAPDPCDNGSSKKGSRQQAGNQASEVRYVLRLVSEPVGREPVPVVMGRGQCGRQGECRPSKEALGVRVCVEPFEPVDPADRAVERVRAFRGLRRTVLERVLISIHRSVSRARGAQVSLGGTGTAIVDALLLDMRDDPPRTSCRLVDQLCAARDVFEGTVSDPPAGGPQNVQQAASAVARAFGALLDDRRQAYLASACEDCCDRAGVALAEVWVGSEAQDCAPEACSLVGIDVQPPAREVLHPRSLWWRADEVALYDAYFRDVREACVMLTARGLCVEAREVSRAQVDPPGIVDEPEEPPEVVEIDYGLDVPEDVRERPAAEERFEEEIPEEETPEEEIPAEDVPSGPAETRTPNAIFEEWLTTHASRMELTRSALYDRSDLHAPCSAKVTLWTVRQRVVAITVDQGGRVTLSQLGRRVTSSFRDYLRYTFRDWGTLVGEQIIPIAPRKGPDPLKEMISGIGGKVEKVLFRGGLRSLEQLAEVKYEAVNDLVSPVLINFRRSTFEDWVGQANKLLADNAGRESLRTKYGAAALKRYKKVTGGGA